MLGLLLTFSLLDIRSAECRIACRLTGFDDGRYEEIQPKENLCLCIDIRDYFELTDRKRIILPKPRKAAMPAKEIL